MRIATWNVNSLKARLPRVEAWLGDAQPDVLCLQETKLADAAFPAMAFQSLGYESVHHGEGRWNGVAILSRVGIEDPHVGFGDGDEPDPEARLLWATCGGVRVASAYVPNGREARLTTTTATSSAWLARLRTHLDEPPTRCRRRGVPATSTSPPPTTTCGTRKFIDGSTHVTEPERAPFRSLARAGASSTRSASRNPGPRLFS